MDVRHLPVVDAELRPVGIVSERDLRGAPNVRVREVMSGPVATARASTTAAEIARTMLEDRLGAIAVLGKTGRLRGVVTYQDVLAILPAEVLELAAEALMTRSPRTVVQSADPEEAISVMQELEVRHVPVVDDEGDLVGIVSDRDLGLMSATFIEGETASSWAEGRARLSVGQLMSADVASVGEDDTIADVVSIMRDEHCGAVPVIDGESKVAGIVSYVDVLRAALPALEIDATQPTVLHGRTSMLRGRHPAARGSRKEPSIEPPAKADDLGFDAASDDRLEHQDQEIEAHKLYVALTNHLPGGLDLGIDGERVYLFDVDGYEEDVTSMPQAFRIIQDWQARHLGS
jgi:acetoin utilization protein AcuB